MINDGFGPYYGHHRRYDKSVAQNNVRQKSKELHIRFRKCDKQLENDLENLADELKQDKSKVARDVLTDFFIEKHEREWREEIKHWN